ncbi:uncharacterized protein LOC119615695 [Lucilia sericata]|uniref:uncharacterized protein LOC119615695 n=1 Tax=Lucilia sericata TaxID=13632 RepID=UPI0018A8089D|nr:uncharacterized protein LOC119615695 [Lucilia sericata]
MNNLKWMGHSATILDIHKNLRADLKSCEVTLVAKGHCVKAHRFVLSSCSDLLRCLLTDVPIGQECCVMVPDIKGHLLDNVLAFIYLGECSLSSTNLSEFLEAINILGIKSAISFECNTNALQTAQNSQQNSIALDGTSTSMAPASSTSLGSSRQVAVSAAVEATLHQEEIIETQSVMHTEANTPTTSNSATNPGTTRELDFLDVYHEPQHKITYSIEHVPGSTAGNEYILTENSGTFTLTHSGKLESTSSPAESSNMEVTEDENCESHIIEEYSSGDEPLIQIGETAQEHHVTVVQQPTPQQHHNQTNTIPISSTATTTTAIIQVKPKMKSLKLKHQPATQQIITKIEQLSEDTPPDDPISILQTSNESFALLKDASMMSTSNTSHEESTDFSLNNSGPSATELAYQAMINEGMSLPKAADKFNVSKAELWRRVRSTGVEQQNKSIKLDPDKIDVIELASKAVINEGLSLQKAAIRYDISKTVLWRRVRKHPQYMKTARENPIIAKAYERLKSGESLKSISQDLDIPMSTLHRHKVRLSQTGQLPDFVTCKKRDSMSKDDLKLKLAKAVHACVHEGMSQNHAANLFQISKSTLWRHLQKRVAEAEAAETESMGDDDEIKQEVILS